MSKETGQKSLALYAILGSLMVSIILVGLGYLTYTSSGVDHKLADNTQKATTPTTKTTQSDTTLPADNQPVDAEEIKRKINELDKQFSENNKDFENSDLSDSSLGF